MAHSYSSTTCAETCLYRYHLKYKLRTPEPANKYADRGTKIHKAAEDYVNGKGTARVPKDLLKLASQFKEARTLKANAEAWWSLDKDWRPTDDRDSRYIIAKVDLHWFESVEVQKRGQTTMRQELAVVDVKSGRVRDFQEQARFYCTMGLAMYPTVERAYAQFWMTDQGFVVPENKPYVFTRSQLPSLRRELQFRLTKIEKTKKFEPKRCGYCKYCSYSKRKEGPCKY